MSYGQRLQTVIDEGRLLWGAWADERDGKQLLCAYTALLGDPEARPGSCPAEVAPKWIAYLIPWMDDIYGDDRERRLVLMRRLVALADDLHRVSRACEWRAREAIVREAAKHTTDAEVTAICNRIADLCARSASGEDCTKELAAARAEAAEAAARAAQAARSEAAARSAAEAAAAETARAVRAAETAETARAVRAAAETVGDRLAHRILDLIEQDLSIAEGK